MGSLEQWVWLAPLLFTTADAAVRWRRTSAQTSMSPTYRLLFVGRWLMTGLLPSLFFGAGLVSGAATLDDYFHAPSVWPVEALFLSLLALAAGLSIWVTHRGGAALLVAHPGVVARKSSVGIVFQANVVLAMLSISFWGRVWQAWAPPAGLALAAANLIVLAYDLAPRQASKSFGGPLISLDELQQSLRRGQATGLLIFAIVLIGIVASALLNGPRDDPRQPAYATGVAALERGDTDAAQQAFEQAGSYADAPAQLRESFLRAAERAATEQRWEDAAAAVAELDHLSLVHDPAVEHLLARYPQLRAAVERQRHAIVWQEPLRQIGALETQRPLNAIAFSADGSQLLTATGAGSAGSIEVWDLAMLRREQLLTVWHNLGLGEYGLSAFTVDVSPTGDAFLSAHTRAKDQPPTLALWKVGDTKPRLSIPGRLGRFSPDGRRIAGANELGRLTLWDAATGSVLATLQASAAEVTDVAWGKAGETLLALDEHGQVALWEVPELRVSRSLGIEGSLIASSRDGRLATVADGATLSVVDLVTNTPINQMSAGGAIVALAFSPDGSMIATAERIQREPSFGASQVQGTVAVYDTRSGQRLAMASGIADELEAITFSPDGRTLALASETSGVTFWRP